ncbi:hypothetical protein ACFPAH_02110 [Massilia sp. GCM10023247]
MLMGTVHASITACAGRRATIDVLINGNRALAQDCSEMAAAITSSNCTLRIWSIDAPDKAHTWNEYVHHIWDTEGITFFIDGYARPRSDAFNVIEQHLASKPNAMAASAVPTSGRSAKRMRETMLRRGGGIHGNLYALTATSMQGVKATGFRLPLGLYRTDPLLGAALTYRLDPSNNPWTRGSVVAVGDATWDVEGISEMSYKNAIAYFKRRLRQAQGILESQAFRDHMSIQRLPPRLLPATAQEMVNNWLASQPALARSLFLKHPLCLYAARQLRQSRDWSKTQIAPMLLRKYPGDQAARPVS